MSSVFKRFRLFGESRLLGTGKRLKESWHTAVLASTFTFLLTFVFVVTFLQPREQLFFTSNGSPQFVLVFRQHHRPLVVDEHYTSSSGGRQSIMLLLFSTFLGLIERTLEHWSLSFQALTAYPSAKTSLFTHTNLFHHMLSFLFHHKRGRVEVVAVHPEGVTSVINASAAPSVPSCKRSVCIGAT